MAWIAADKDECIYIFPIKPTRYVEESIWITPEFGNFYQIPKLVCKWLVGKVLTWEDEPIEIEIKNK